MKNAVKSLILLIFVSIAAQMSAQTSGVLWVGSRSGNANANAVHQAIVEIYDAFANGDDKKGWAGYTEEAAEIDPIGHITFGKKALRESWEGFMAIVDEQPKFSYDNVLVRMLTNDVALAVFDSAADIKVGGQQLGGNTKGMAVLRKINGQWKLEFDSITPIVPMPEQSR